MTATAVLLPSPLLPVVAYSPLADALGRRGWGVAVAHPPPAPAGPGPVLTAYASFVGERRPDVVVAHSNAGRYAVAVASGARVVYVDAALPPEHGKAPLAPEGLLSGLASMVGGDGRLPPWTRWWPEEDLAAVLPDTDVLAGIRATEERLPLSYFQARLGAPPGWTGSPSGLPRLRRHLRRRAGGRAPARVACGRPRKRRPPAPPRRSRRGRGRRRRVGGAAGDAPVTQAARSSWGLAAPHETLSP